MFVLEKLLNDNINMNILLNTNITEWDLKAAHLTALYFIKGEEIYNKLSELDKETRNINIGKMIGKDHNLRKEIDKLVLSWFNEFLKVNKIEKNNFLATTPDSILIYNKLPIKTEFENGIVKFRNKEKVSYTSLFKLPNRYLILFDIFSRRMRIKGLGTEEKTDQIEFVNKILKPLCHDLCKNSLDNSKILYICKRYKEIYFGNKDNEIFRSVEDKNNFIYYLNDKIYESEAYLEERENFILDKSKNYLNIMLPLMRMFI